jgi:HEAT repeat protein
MIDLCNKMEQIRIGDDRATLKNHFADAVKSTSVPLEVLTKDQREVVELAYYSALAHPNPLMHVVGDPAAWESNFAHALDRVALRIDSRTNSELREAALNHADPMMREQAVFEYADRNVADALAFISQIVRRDADHEVRWNSLWAIEKLGGVEAIQALREFV